MWVINLQWASSSLRIIHRKNILTHMTRCENRVPKNGHVLTKLFLGIKLLIFALQVEFPEPSGSQLQDNIQKWWLEWQKRSEFWLLSEKKVKITQICDSTPPLRHVWEWNLTRNVVVQWKNALLSVYPSKMLPRTVLGFPDAVS